MYYNEVGFEQNFVESFKCSLLAAEQGHIEAAKYVGLMYSEGEGVDVDYEESVRLLRVYVGNDDDPMVNGMLGSLLFFWVT